MHYHQLYVHGADARPMVYSKVSKACAITARLRAQQDERDVPWQQQQDRNETLGNDIYCHIWGTMPLGRRQEIISCKSTIFSRLFGFKTSVEQNQQHKKSSVLCSLSMEGESK